MPTIEASDGAKIFYRAAGESPPLILCHASFSTHLHWIGQEEALAAFCQPISWDYRGHGKPDAPHDVDAYSMDHVQADLDRVLAWGAGGEPAVLAGLSFGGLASLHFAARQLQRVRGLVLVASGPGFKNPEAAARWQAASGVSTR